MRSRLVSSVLLGIALVSLSVLPGCPALYPEFGTRTRQVTAGVPLDPPPPEDLRWLRVLSAQVPERTRDGRTWQTNGKFADPYAKVLINGREIFKTPVESNTLKPTWPDGPHGNVKIGFGDKLRVELWDANALYDKPIGVEEIRVTQDHLIQRELRIELDGGADMVLAFEPAHAMMGAGLWYELRTDSCFVTRLVERSPAERAGILAGDQILKIRARDVKVMSADEIRSLFNAIPLGGLELLVKHPDGSTAQVNLKEGPIYPEYLEHGPID